MGGFPAILPSGMDPQILTNPSEAPATGSNPHAEQRLIEEVLFESPEIPFRQIQASKTIQAQMEASSQNLFDSILSKEGQKSSTWFWVRRSFRHFPMVCRDIPVHGLSEDKSAWMVPAPRTFEFGQ
jgi:hypothetical protein